MSCQFETSMSHFLLNANRESLPMPKAENVFRFSGGYATVYYNIAADQREDNRYTRRKNMNSNSCLGVTDQREDNRYTRRKCSVDFPF